MGIAYRDTIDMTIISYSTSAVHVDKIVCLAGNNSQSDPKVFQDNHRV
jgi:hypothetical protein